jgi:hypothetical protein
MAWNITRCSTPTSASSAGAGYATVGISMGEYYITGYVYFIQAGDDPVVKIGTTIEPLEKRLFALQTANHKKLKLIGAIDLRKLHEAEYPNRIEFSQRARCKEAEIHTQFLDQRIQGEWFNLTDDLLNFIQKNSNVVPVNT